VEDAGSDVFTICRNLHGMRIAGFFDRANAILVGRSSAPGYSSFSHHEAVLDAIGTLNVPIIADVECGHIPPYMPIVNGIHGRIVYSSSRSELTQTLG
jgi:muramoyltetrapeptide carboxypeptidase LdcA involved in peptidoglycan recycling